MSPMHSLPLAVKGPGRRMGRDKSEDLPMTLGPWFLQDYKAGDFEGVILILIVQLCGGTRSLCYAELMNTFSYLWRHIL